jgi:hypothetical protein
MTEQEKIISFQKHTSVLLLSLVEYAGWDILSTAKDLVEALGPESAKKALQGEQPSSPPTTDPIVDSARVERSNQGWEVVDDDVMVKVIIKGGNLMIFSF